MQVCTSLQSDNHASTPPLNFLQAGCPSCRPTNSVKALKAKSCTSYLQLEGMVEEKKGISELTQVHVENACARVCW